MDSFSVIKSKVTRLFSDVLFQDSAILIAATVISGGLNYLYHISMGRLLGPENYGIFGSLFALMYVLLIISDSVEYCSLKFTSALDQNEMVGFLRGFLLRVTVFSIGLFAVIAAASPTLADYLQVSNINWIIIIGGSVLFVPMNSVNTGALRGFQYFIPEGGIRIFGALAKFVLGITLVVLGFGVSGALAATVIAPIFVFSIATFYLREWYLANGEYQQFGAVYKYAYSSILVAFCFNIPTNFDIVLVKHLFTSADAGYYSAVTVFGKVMIFLAAGVSGALFPKVSENHSTGKSTVDLLNRGLFYSGVAILSLVAVYLLVPRGVIQLLYGPEYLEGAYLLPWYAVMVAVFSLAVVLLNYELAKDKRAYVWVFSLLTVLEIILAYTLAQSMLDIIQIMLVVNLIAIIVGLYIAYDNRVRSYIWRRFEDGV